MNPIITASLTGPAATKKQTPAMPGTPEEIAESAKEAYEAGAAVIHIHLRENDDFTTDLDVARRTVDLVREACPGIVQLSTGGGMAYEDRTRIVEAKPAMATLNPGTMTIGDFEFRNPPMKMYKLAERMLELGIKAEVEMYDTGHLGLTHGPAEEGAPHRAAAGVLRHGRQGRHAGRSQAARLHGATSCRRTPAGR